MDTVRQTFDRFLRWIGWYNGQEDNTGRAESVAKADSRKLRSFLNEDGFLDADFPFHVDVEKRTCRYIALHPNRLYIPLIWAKHLGVEARYRVMVGSSPFSHLSHPTKG